MKRLPLLICIMAMCAANGVARPSGFSKPAGKGTTETSRPDSNDKAVIKKIIHDSFAWALTKDRALFESIFARDDDFFTFFPSGRDTVVGWKQFEKSLDNWMDPRNKAKRFDIRNLRLVMAKTGNAAWFSAVVDDEGEWDGKPWGAKDIRWTGVLEKRNGKWVIVQQHMSSAADKVLADTEARVQTLGADAAQAALDYIEGWYEGDAARVEKVLHPEFVRRIAAVTVAGDDFFRQQDRAQFLDAVRRGGDKATPVDQRLIKATVRDLTRTSATVRVESAYYVEYLNLVKRLDRWQIVHVLWENVPNEKN